MLDFITLTDGYKVDHRRQYPPGTTHVYSNFTPRASRNGDREVVFLGLQYALDKYFHESPRDTFWDVPRNEVEFMYYNFLRRYLGDEAAKAVGTDHIAALHDLGYLPLEVRALPEGTPTPIGVPMFTVENTHPDFYWLTNYFETLLSATIWLPSTSATMARRYRRLLDRHTNNDPIVPYQAHDFSFRGMGSVEAAALSGMGHLVYFEGTDSLPAIDVIGQYYDGFVGASVPATEHSVMCAGGQESETATFERLLKLYPKGIVSVVSDTWDLWKVLTETVPALKDKILARDGKLVIRPDSGDPVLILTGDENAPYGSPARRGVVGLLWDIFGGTHDNDGLRRLDPHIGVIYGDSITLARCQAICERLEWNSFSATNVVFGIGSYTYQYTTRDVQGFAMKATWTRQNGSEVFLSKNPITDNGTKKSHRGRLAVVRGYEGRLEVIDNLDTYQQSMIQQNLLKPVWRDGEFLEGLDWADVRANALG